MSFQSILITLTNPWLRRRLDKFNELMRREGKRRQLIQENGEREGSCSSPSACRSVWSAAAALINKDTEREQVEDRGKRKRKRKGPLFYLVTRGQRVWLFTWPFFFFFLFAPSIWLEGVFFFFWSATCLLYELMGVIRNNELTVPPSLMSCLNVLSPLMLWYLANWDIFILIRASIANSILLL